MAIYISSLLTDGGLPIQGTLQGAIQSQTAKITIPAGVEVGNGDVFRLARVDKNARILRVRFENDQLDSSTGITATAGVTAVRAVRDPSKAYNASTNPYITGALSADRSESFVAAATMQTALRAAGRTITNTVPTQAKLAELDGTFDIALTVTAAVTTQVATARELIVTIEYTAPQQIPGEFTGSGAYNYENETANV
jgi:hypothetical protein